MEELEEAQRRKKDPRSRSERPCFGLFVSGPKSSMCSFYVANLINVSVIGLNFVTAYFLETQKVETIIAYVAMGIGLFVNVLMLSVGCSDPGIISRK